MSDPETDARLVELCGYIVGMVKSRCRKKITVLIDGDTFGVCAVEDLTNPRGPIPAPPQMGPQASAQETS